MKNTKKDLVIKLGPTRVENKYDNDWCHICGLRGDRGFVLIEVVKNAEHAVVNYPEGTEADRPVRICEWCLGKLAKHAAKGKEVSNFIKY